MSDHDKGSEKVVGALTAGLLVLRYLIRNELPVGVSQVARELDINPSTCFNLLRTLVHENLVVFNPAKKTYSIGLGMLELTKGLTERDRILQFVRPRLAEIAQTHGVTATLWRRLNEDRVILVERADTDSAIRVYMAIGQRLPIFVAALGRCMAAHSGLSRNELRRRFESLRWQTAPDFEAYWRDVQQVTLKGYATDRDNFVKGVTTVSAPVLDASGHAVMAISAVGFSGQFTAKFLDKLAADKRRHAQQISLALNGQEPAPPKAIPKTPPKARKASPRPVARKKARSA